MASEFNEGGDDSQIPTDNGRKNQSHKNKESCYMTWFVSGLRN